MYSLNDLIASTFVQHILEEDCFAGQNSSTSVIKITVSGEYDGSCVLTKGSKDTAYLTDRASTQT